MSDWAKAEKNRERYRQRKNNKPECMEPGCPTRINYTQKKYCLKHAAEYNERKAEMRLERRSK